MEIPGASGGPVQLNCSWWLSILLSYRPTCLVMSELFVCLDPKVLWRDLQPDRLSRAEDFAFSSCLSHWNCSSLFVASTQHFVASLWPVGGHVASTVTSWGLCGIYSLWKNPVESLWPWHGFLGIWNKAGEDISISSVFWGVGLTFLVLSMLRCRRPTTQLSFPLPLCWETANSTRGNNHKSRTYTCGAKPFPKFLTGGP